MVADMVHLVAYMEVDKVADMVAKKGTQFGKKKKGTTTQFGKKKKKKRVPNLVRGACKKKKRKG